MHPNSKLPHVGTTIFTVMSALAREQGAINLSQGFPDFDCSPKLLELACKYLKAGFNQYAPMPGLIQLRECIAGILSESYGAEYHPESEITVTAGATQAIYTAMAAFLHPGDEVILFEPAYDCYAPAIELQGAKPIYSTLLAPHFSINWQDVRNKIGAKTRAILINSPHNPSGSIISPADLDELESLASRHDLLIISDEVYEHMVFDQNPHSSMATRPALRERSVIVSSFGKTIHATGWKIGYVAAPAELSLEFRKLHQFLVFAVNHPLQMALAEYLRDASVYTELRHFYQAKRDMFLNLCKTSRFKPLPCQGTYFQVMDYSAISSENDSDFAIHLTKAHKVAGIPFSVFYKNKPEQKLLRFCFAKKDETLEKAAEILCRL
ncbi:MAG TPA: methionine aminotransferase [Bacteroidia bacterium]|nr:methionine aminotransferase [Bacteroidia bacterium]